MKRIFPIIVILIALSLVGIILIQVSWLKNMLLLREDQVRQRVENVATLVCNELGQYKSAPASIRPFSPLDEGFRLDFGKPYNVSQRFTATELFNKIRLAFVAQKMEDIPFEFGLANTTSGIFQIERQSLNFEQWFSDTTNHYIYIGAILPPSGS
ncbi:MAG: sensor histidine kinase, partial [Bacteroidota bacterium]|nr:sensor histidine kinase [Bacteroidota bacterium]